MSTGFPQNMTDGVENIAIQEVAYMGKYCKKAPLATIPLSIRYVTES